MNNSTAYDQGFIDGLAAFAYWRDGTGYVGSCGITLNDAIARRQDLPTYHYRPVAPRINGIPTLPPAPFRMTPGHPLRARMEWALELGARWVALDLADFGVDPDGLARALIVGVTGEYTGQGRDYGKKQGQGDS